MSRNRHSRRPQRATDAGEPWANPASPHYECSWTPDELDHETVKDLEGARRVVTRGGVHVKVSAAAVTTADARYALPGLAARSQSGAQREERHDKQANQ